ADAAQGDVCDIANDNDPGQVVLSGSKAAIDRVLATAKSYGVRRALPLPVSAPFHCSLMRPAANSMAEVLASATVLSPSVPLVANVSASPIVDPNEIRRSLVEQVTGTVRWRESVLAMVNAGVTHFFEIGAGKVLAGLVGRIERASHASSIGAPEALELLAGELDLAR
ncbi:MAG: ACP S-malonyltransferase, partial [Hyphomicrobiaceae bacterium]